MRTELALVPLAVLLAAGSPFRAATSGSGLPIADAVMDRQWTGAWIACAGAPERDSGVFRFRKVIELASVPSRFVVHVSADQRFVLHVNGQRVGIGPSRGDILFWRFETFDLAPYLKPGANLLSAIVWNWGTQAPAAQVTDRIGFVVQGDGAPEQVANTDTSWECAPEPGHQAWPEGMNVFRVEALPVHRRGPGRAARRGAVRLELGRAARAGCAARPMGARGRVGRGQPAHDPHRTRARPDPGRRLLVPDELPPMEYALVPAGGVVKSEGASVEGFPEKGPARIPARTRATLLLDRKTLVTAYPELGFSGGRRARVRISYQEALLEPGDKWLKGPRDVFEGKRFVGYSDDVVPDGGRGRVFHSLWELEPWREMLEMGLSTFAEIPDASVRSEGVRS